MKDEILTYEMKTLPDILINAAESHPDHGIGYVRSDGSVCFQTYADLLSLSMSLLTGLNKLGLRPKDKVILALDKNDETVPLLWACFLGGIIPTVLQPPVSFSDINPAGEKIATVYKKLGQPKIILSDERAESWESGQVMPEDTIARSSIEKTNQQPKSYSYGIDEIAFIQFSSGSTGEPKGVVLTHQNIIINLKAIYKKIELNPSDRLLNWMPFYHDMGLIGLHFTPLYRSVNQYIIDPVDFIKKPFLWLDLLSEKKITITACPNFGQALITRYLKRRQHGSWDFSNIKVVFNGAEPISSTIMNEFIELFKLFRFNPEAMMPVYGMAEATLAITFSGLRDLPVVTPFDRRQIQHHNKAVKAGRKQESALHLVSVGKAIDDCSIRIVDDRDIEVAEGSIGHIQTAGGNITQGYYNDNSRTENLFCGKWLRTGDLGFIHNEDLYITGRFKDIIFLRGQNWYAHDLEHTAQKIEGIGYGKIVIAGVFDEKKGQDILIVFITGSINNNTIELCIKIRNHFRGTMGITIDTFIPVRSNQIPKTSSGKIQRYKLASRYLKGEFDETIKTVNEIIPEVGFKKN